MIYEDFLQVFFDVKKENIHDMSDSEVEFLKDYFKNENSEELNQDISVEFIEEYIVIEANYKRLYRFFSIYEYGDLFSEYFSEENLSKFDKVNPKKEDYIKKILVIVQKRFKHYDSLKHAFQIDSKEAGQEVTITYDNLADSLKDKIIEVEEQFDLSKENYYNSEENYKESKIIFNEAEKNVSGLVSNMLTVLGIFVSIVVAVLIVYITVFLDKDNNSFLFFTNIPQLNLLKYVLTIHLLGNFVFMFLFFIAKLTNRTLMSSCVNFFPLQNKTESEKEESEENRYLLDDKLEKQKPCTRCAYACSSYRIIVNRLFHVLLFNGAMLFFYDCLYVWWYIVYLYDLDEINLYIIAKEPYLLLFVLLLVINIIFIVMIKKFVIDKPTLVKGDFCCIEQKKKQ